MLFVIDYLDDVTSFTMKSVPFSSDSDHVFFKREYEHGCEVPKSAGSSSHLGQVHAFVWLSFSCLPLSDGTELGEMLRASSGGHCQPATYGVPVVVAISLGWRTHLHWKLSEKKKKKTSEHLKIPNDSKHCETIRPVIGWLGDQLRSWRSEAVS